MKLTSIRKESGISQIEIAMLSGLPRYTIQYFEQGIKILKPLEEAKIKRAMRYALLEKSKLLRKYADTFGSDD